MNHASITAAQLAEALEERWGTGSTQGKPLDLNVQGELGSLTATVSAGACCIRLVQWDDRWKVHASITLDESINATALHLDDAMNEGERIVWATAHELVLDPFGLTIHEDLVERIVELERQGEALRASLEQAKAQDTKG